MADSPASALVCDIQRFSVHDGPGIRTNVYFKGCSLSCQWCHNPETIAFKNELVVRAHRCIHRADDPCGDCLPLCPQGSISLTNEKLEVDRASCDDCLLCVDACPAEALDPAARSYDTDALLAEISGESEFYGDDGGLTITGGEPLVQAKFLREFLPRVREAGIHITVETAGHWSYEQVREVLDQIDLILFDVKMIDPRRHLEFVGRANDQIIDNLGRCVADGRQVIPRMPVVPGVNDDDDNIRAVAQLLTRLGLDEIVLLPHHTAGAVKREYIGKATGDSDPLGPLTQVGLAAVRESFRACGITPLAA